MCVKLPPGDSNSGPYPPHSTTQELKLVEWTSHQGCAVVTQQFLMKWCTSDMFLCEISPGVQNNVSINNNQATNPFSQNFGSLVCILFFLMHSNRGHPNVYCWLIVKKKKKGFKSDPLINSSSLSLLCV